MGILSNTFKNEFETFLERIERANSEAMLNKCSKSLDNLFANGIFTESQFMELDGLIFEKLSILPE